MKIEYVTWQDSSAPRGTWCDKDMAAVDVADMTVQSVGFVVFEDEERVVLAHSVMGDNVGAPITIPKRSIVSRLQISPNNIELPGCIPKDIRFSNFWDTANVFYGAG